MLNPALKERLKGFTDLFRQAGEKYEIDPLLLVAIAIKESSLQPDSFRKEPAFYKRYVSRLTVKRIKEYNPWVFALEAVAKEKEAEACSYGLMQVMGLTARELGFRNMHLRDLHESQINIEYGAKVIKKQLVRYSGDVEKALSAYNAGTFTDHNHHSYVVPVMEYYNKLKTDREVKSWFANS